MRTLKKLIEKYKGLVKQKYETIYIDVVICELENILRDRKNRG